MLRILFILPTYNKFQYAWGAADSFSRYSDNALDRVLLVDDASSLWEQQNWGLFWDALTPNYAIHRFEVNGGLTRSWNYGLQYARDKHFEYAVCGNSDILFTPGWADGLTEAARLKLDLVGPVSNCPGVRTYDHQRVDRFYPNYQTSDDPAELTKVADYLSLAHSVGPCPAIEAPINGFFMFAKTAKWWEGRYDDQHVFCPVNEVDSRGRRNRTPLMTLNEEELQARWRTKGLRVGFTPASFIFHYRAVSRGNRYLVPGWYRTGEHTS